MLYFPFVSYSKAGGRYHNDHLVQPVTSFSVEHRRTCLCSFIIKPRLPEALRKEWSLHCELKVQSGHLESLPTVPQSKAGSGALWSPPPPVSCVKLPSFLCTAATRLVSWRKGFSACGWLSWAVRSLQQRFFHQVHVAICGGKWELVIVVSWPCWSLPEGWSWGRGSASGLIYPSWPAS